MGRVLEYLLVYHYGDSFDDYKVIWKDAAGAAIDLSGYSAKFQVRDSAGVLVLELTSGAGLTISAAAGTITFDATPVMMTQSPSALVQDQKYKYDLQVSTGSAVKTLIKGDFWVDKQITT